MYIHHLITNCYITPARDKYIVLIEGYIAHAYLSIQKLRWSGEGIEAPWLLYGLEDFNKQFQQHFQGLQSTHSGFIGLCTAQMLKGLNLELQLNDGSIEKLPLDLSEYMDSPKSSKWIQKSPLDKLDIEIILPTYKPSLGHLFEQISSIKKQQGVSWHCLVIDDASDDDTVHHITNLVGHDERFSIALNKENLGFYLNIEQGLRLAKPAKYLAFADQDDVWDENKLLTSFNAITKERSSLVFCDQRITDNQLNVLQESFWSNRYMDIEHFDKLMLMNSATGAASLFESALLKIALPFPRTVGKMYHDHWLALIAYLQKGIKFINESLYSYRQHADQDTGFSTGAKKPLANNLSHLNRLTQLLKQPVNPLLDKLSLEVLRHDVLRFAVMARVLKNRFDLTKEQQENISLFTIERPKILYDYLRKETLDTLSTPTASLGQEAYVTASALLACLGDGSYQNIYVKV